MNVEFDIKIEEGVNKNFLVFISTELTKKLNFELISTSKLEWVFKRKHAMLTVQHGKYEEEEYEVGSGYSSRKEKRTRDVFVPNCIVLNFDNIEDIESVNNVFNIVDKYAKLIIDECTELDLDDDLVDMLDEVAATAEED